MSSSKSIEIEHLFLMIMRKIIVFITIIITTTVPIMHLCKEHLGASQPSDQASSPLSTDPPRHKEGIEGAQEREPCFIFMYNGYR